MGISGNWQDWLTVSAYLFLSLFIVWRVLGTEKER